MDEYDPLIEFSDRLWNEWLPTYCHDPKRGFALAGYKASSNKVTPVDAWDFLRALDSHVVEDCGGGRYRLNKRGRRNHLLGRAKGQITTANYVVDGASHHDRVGGALAPRLRLATELLGDGVAQRAVRFHAFLSEASATEHIAGEVKNSVKGLDLLLENLVKTCRDPALQMATATAAQVNAYRKWEGLCRSRAPLFWAVGPGGVSHLFQVSYRSQSEVCLHEVSTDCLAYSGLGA
jgi:hypothetical protein